MGPPEASNSRILVPLYIKCSVILLITVKEKRKYKRFLIEGMDVQCNILFTTEVRLLNISLGGAALSLTKRLNMGSEYTLKIDSEDDTISLKGTVVWEKMTSVTREVRGRRLPVYEAGIRFNNVLTERGADLINFIRENISEDAVKTRVQGLRVNIIQPGKTVILDDRRTCSVKIISLGGMLLETEEALNTEGRFLMEIIFPEDKKSIRTLGRTAYCVEIPGKTPKRYDAGIEFIEMSEKDKARLKEFIDILQTI
jgi:c-di-GMP-binding flagellar brake protein YcgR